MEIMKKMKKMNACNACNSFFKIMLFKRRRRLFCRRGWRSTSIATLDLWMLVFVWTFLYFLTLLSLFHFPETPLGDFPMPTHKGRDSTFIIRMDLLPLPSSVVSAALLWVIDESHITEYRYYKIFLIFSLKHDVVMTSVKEIKRI